MYTGNLKDIAEKVRSDLDEAFGFMYETIAHIEDLSEEEGQILYRVIARNAGFEKHETENDLNRILSGGGSGRCLYLGIMYPGELDHAVFYNCDQITILPVIAHEITHGEYLAEHARKYGLGAELTEKFPKIAREFMANMGYYCSLRKAGREVHPAPLESHLVVSHDYDSLAAHGIFKQVVESGREIPYSDLFHADGKNEMWKIIRGIVRPEIRACAPRGCRESVHNAFRNVLQDAGLDAEIEISEWLTTSPSAASSHSQPQ